MTDLPPNNIAALNRAIAYLLDQLDQCLDHADTKDPAPQMDKITKSISMHLKTYADAAAHFKDIAAQEQKTKYTRYEDMPPPSPEDRERFKARFLDLIDKLRTGQFVPDHPDEAVNSGHHSGA